MNPYAFLAGLIVLLLVADRERGTGAQENDPLARGSDDTGTQSRPRSHRLRKRVVIEYDTARKRKAKAKDNTPPVDEPEEKETDEPDTDEPAA